MKTFTNWLVKFGCTIKGFIMAFVVLYVINVNAVVNDESYAELFIKICHPNVKGFRKK